MKEKGVVPLFIKSTKTMQMNTPVFSCAEARKIDLVAYLQALGYTPQKVQNQDYWYFSPLREENTASFKVNRRLNVWFDHGTGKGGNTVDFGILYHRCSVRELLQKLKDRNGQTLSFHPPLTTSEIQVQQVDAGEKEKLQIVAVHELRSAALLAYLKQRKIPVDLARIYCNEVCFELYGRQHRALGFRNNSGGYELRSASFKGSSAPKDVTILNGDENSRAIAVFEGFFSFLSYQTLLAKGNRQRLIQLPNQPLDSLVLNSLSFFEKARPVLEKHPCIHLYLDRDRSGIKATLQALIRSKQYQDQSHQYRHFKDLNDYLRQQGPHQKQGLRPGRPF